VPGETRYNDPQDRAQQGKIILARRIAGESVTSIAKDIGLHPNTILRRLQEAKREANLEGAKDRVINELLGPAIAAFKQLLEEGDYNAARDVLQGLGVLPKNGPPQTETTAKVEMTLDQWREMRARTTYDQVGDAEAPAIAAAQGDPETFSAEIVGSDDQDAGQTAEGSGADPDTDEGI
jgi:hypothetical protein